MVFTPEQISELSGIVSNYHFLFIAEMVGINYLTEEELEVLQSFNLDITKLPNPKVTDAFNFGQLAYALQFARENSLLKTMSYPQFTRYLKNAGGIPLNEKEQNALSFMQRQAHNDIKGLGNRIMQKVQQLANNAEQETYTAIEADAELRTRYEKIINEEAQRTVLLRESADYLASSLKGITRDYARDFNRISDYVMHTAYQYGRLYEAQKLGGDNEDLRYYKQVYSGACKHCIKAYLTDGIGSEPRLFTYEELLKNSTNIGRKEYLPVVGATHPFCRCELMSVRTSLYDWNDAKNDFVAKGKQPVEYPESEGLITITIGDKTIKV